MQTQQFTLASNAQLLGLTIPEVVVALDIYPRTADADWTYA